MSTTVVSTTSITTTTTSTPIHSISRWRWSTIVSRISSTSMTIGSRITSTGTATATTTTIVSISLWGWSTWRTSSSSHTISSSIGSTMGWHVVITTSTTSSFSFAWTHSVPSIITHGRWWTTHSHHSMGWHKRWFGWIKSTGRNHIFFFASNSGSSKTSSQTSWQPIGHSMSSLNITYNCSSFNFHSICSTICLLHIFFMFVFNKGITSRFGNILTFRTTTTSSSSAWSGMFLTIFIHTTFFSLLFLLLLLLLLLFLALKNQLYILHGTKIFQFSQQFTFRNLIRQSSHKEGIVTIHSIVFSRAFILMRTVFLDEWCHCLLGFMGTTFSTLDRYGFGCGLNLPLWCRRSFELGHVGCYTGQSLDFFTTTTASRTTNCART
mmetsp:Transcript_20363/g.28636  ORF Transcript_20363/g.28636 Transcript_20363/m.28636 type:complete len:380 (+) Transcript_20363:1055-2194(+)